MQAARRSVLPRVIVYDAALTVSGNPRPVTAGDLRRLLRAAWAGADPAAIAREGSR